MKKYWHGSDPSPTSRNGRGCSQGGSPLVVDADWSKPPDIKEQYGDASILKGGRVVFNIAGNRYRLVVWINYPYRVVYVRFVGSHKAYDKIDAETI